MSRGIQQVFDDPKVNAEIRQIIESEWADEFADFPKPPGIESPKYPKAMRAFEEHPKLYQEVIALLKREGLNQYLEYLGCGNDGIAFSLGKSNYVLKICTVGHVKHNTPESLSSSTTASFDEPAKYSDSYLTPVPPHVLRPLVYWNVSETGNNSYSAGHDDNDIKIVIMPKLIPTPWREEEGGLRPIAANIGRYGWKVVDPSPQNTGYFPNDPERIPFLFDLGVVEPIEGMTIPKLQRMREEQREDPLDGKWRRIQFENSPLLRESPRMVDERTTPRITRPRLDRIREELRRLEPEIEGGQPIMGPATGALARKPQGAPTMDGP